MCDFFWYLETPSLSFGNEVGFVLSSSEVHGEVCPNWDVVRLVKDCRVRKTTSFNFSVAENMVDLSGGAVARESRRKLYVAMRSFEAHMSYDVKACVIGYCVKIAA